MISFPCIQQLSLDSPWLNAQDDTPPYLRDIRECAERAGLRTHTYFKIVSHIRCKMIWNAESTKDAQMSLWYVLCMCSLLAGAGDVFSPQWDSIWNPAPLKMPPEINKGFGKDCCPAWLRLKSTSTFTSTLFQMWTWSDLHAGPAQICHESPKNTQIR